MKTYWTNFGMKGLLLGSLLWARGERKLAVRYRKV
jgi:hypothetical protein